jgi:hypothetical protein
MKNSFEGKVQECHYYYPEGYNLLPLKYTSCKQASTVSTV